MRLLSYCAFIGMTLGLATHSAQAQSATRGALELDTVSNSDAAEPAAQAATPEERLRWHGTRLQWSHSLTTQTVGVGADVLGRNPFYEMTLSLSPRYYLLENAVDALALQADLGVSREFTNSDTSTRLGEWSLTDLVVFAEYSRVLARSRGYRTRAGVEAPIVELPTSRTSSAQGLQLRLGSELFVDQKVPLAGGAATWFPDGQVRASAGYTYTFAEATEPTADAFQRVRLSPSGRSLPSNQLGGVALAEHQLSLIAQAAVNVHERLEWHVAIGWRPAWEYAFDADAELCVETTTGCAKPDRVAEPERFASVTLFSMGLALQVARPLSLEFAYENLALQLGPDGQRRSPFYSPDARFLLALNAKLDALYVAVSR